MAIINKLFLIIVFCHFTKTEKSDIKTKFSALTCENDGCEKKDNNHILLKRTGFEENEKVNKQRERKNMLYSENLANDVNPENINKITEGDLEFTSSVEITELDSQPSNTKESYTEASKSNFETNFVSSTNPDIPFQNDNTGSKRHLKLNGSHSSSETVSSNFFHPDNSFETTTEISKITTSKINSTTLFTVKKDVSPVSLLRNNTAVCICNLKVDECDINCCCDEDCTSSMKQVFRYCADLKDVSSIETGNHCLNFKSIFKINANDVLMSHGDGLFCIVKINLKINLPFSEGQIIQNVKQFEKKLTGKKFFKYSAVRMKEPKMSNGTYKIGDYLWAVINNGLVPFGIPQYHINNQCNYIQNVRFLTEYSTQCLYSVPGDRNSCENASRLEMNFFLKYGKIIKSPSLIKNQNSSNAAAVCSNETCAEVTTYICPESLKISNCVKSSVRSLLWDKDICKNVVSSVEYHFFHNGIEGIREVRAYFSLANLSSGSDSYFLQTIKLKFFWAIMPVQPFIKSGNPGYIIGKPVMAGKKVFSNNETSPLKKEAIYLSVDPRNWLSVAGSKKGICSYDKREGLGFGENAVHSCLISLNDYDLTNKKCLDLQEIIFKFLIGDEYYDVKSNNRFNKYVATLGNSRVEETGDWVPVIIDTLPIVSSQPSATVLNDIVVCKNMVTELFINIAYSKIGSFKNSQNKILGVRYYFGSPKNIIYSKECKHTDIKSSEMVKISTYVQFIDLSTQPQPEFADTPGFEAKLPHDFFYPFFSAGSLSTHQNTFVIFFLVVLQFCR